MTDEYRIRVRIFAGLVLVLTAVLGGRLAWLQLVQQEEYAGEARSTALRELRVTPARGAIYDRNGVLMVENEQTFTLTITPRYFLNGLAADHVPLLADPVVRMPEDVDRQAFDAVREKVTLLADVMQVPDTTVVRKLEEAIDWNPDRPSRSFRNVTMEEFGRYQENAYQLAGVDYELDQRRRYVSKAKMPHALGYVREISRQELQSLRGDYRQGDPIGKTGLEKRYESYLRGRLGAEIRMVNARGRALGSYRGGAEDVEPRSGYDLRLTIDAKTQALAESLFVNKRGGVVAIDPKSGAILAMHSSPSFDPEIFSGRIDPEAYDRLMTDPAKPQLARATYNNFPPGSTWKPFMALMALQEGAIGPGETVYCGGGHPMGGGRFFTCMGVHGPQTVETAIMNSCNTFFFEMMNRVDVQTFGDYARMFGFGQEAPIEIAEQSEGTVADSAYMSRKVARATGQTGPNIRWEKGWELSLGIGQGDITVTPMQLARYTAAVANRGTLYAPYLVDYLEDPETGDRVYPAVPAPEEIPIEQEYFEMVREGMHRVMNTTARASQIPGIEFGAKTGTAQINRQGIDKDDSVFIIFAPFDDPQIAVAAQVENAGYGGSAAAPIASLLVEMYLKGEVPDSPQKRTRLARVAANNSVPLPLAVTSNEPGE